jgi:hypothetical protein
VLIRSISLFQVLLRASTLHGDGLPFQPCRVDLTRDFKNHYVRVIKGNIVSDRYHCGSASVTLYPTWDPNDTCESSRGTILKIALFISMPCQYGLPVTLCIYLIRLSRRMSPPLAPRSLPPFQLSGCPSCYVVNALFIISCASPPLLS